MPNIKFSYFYRDSCNYKNWGSVIFLKPHNSSIKEIEGVIKRKLIEETWFYPNEWKLPNLYFETLDINNDPTWHEFENISLSNEEPNIQFKIDGETFYFKPL